VNQASSTIGKIMNIRKQNVPHVINVLMQYIKEGRFIVSKQPKNNDDGEFGKGKSL